MKKKILMVDQDDVITTNQVLYLLNEYLKTDYKLSDFKDFYMENILLERYREPFFKFFFQHNPYDYVELFPDVYEVLEELNSLYKLYIATAFVYLGYEEYSGRILTDKYDFFYKKLPFIKPEQYIFLQDKHLLKRDIMIDDRISNLEGAKRKLLFNAYHNQNISDAELQNIGIERVANWQEIGKKLIKNKIG